MDGAGRILKPACPEPRASSLWLEAPDHGSFAGTASERYIKDVPLEVARARPVLLTALAAVLAFIPLTTSVFWGSMACTLIGGTAAGTVLTLVFLPALYAIWFRVRKPAKQPIGDLSLATAQ